MSNDDELRFWCGLSSKCQQWRAWIVLFVKYGTKRSENFLLMSANPLAGYDELVKSYGVAPECVLGLCLGRDGGRFFTLAAVC